LLTRDSYMNILTRKYASTKNIDFFHIPSSGIKVVLYNIIRYSNAEGKVKCFLRRIYIQK